MRRPGAGSRHEHFEILACDRKQAAIGREPQRAACVFHDLQHVLAQCGRSLRQRDEAAVAIVDEPFERAEPERTALVFVDRHDAWARQAIGEPEAMQLLAFEHQQAERIRGDPHAVASILEHDARHEGADAAQ